MSSSPRHLLIVRSGRSPHEMWLLAACILAGITGLVSGEQSRAVVAAFPSWGRIVWYAGLLLWGLLALAGVIRGGVVGLLVERASLLALAGLSFAYGLGAVLFAGPGAAVSTTITVAFGVANLVRAHQISHDFAAQEQAKRARP